MGKSVVVLPLGDEKARVLMKQPGKVSQVPIVALTAYAMREHRERIAAALGFDAVEIFPRSAQELDVRQLKHLLAHHHLRLAALGTGLLAGAFGLRPVPFLAAAFLVGGYTAGLAAWTAVPNSHAVLLGLGLSEREVRARMERFSGVSHEDR